MNKEKIMRTRDALIYDFDKVLPEHRILYEKLNGDLLILELEEKNKKILDFLKETPFVAYSEDALRNEIFQLGQSERGMFEYGLALKVRKLLKEIGELE